MRYRKKPVEIEAMKLEPGDTGEISQWIESNGGLCSTRWDALMIHTLEGVMRAEIGDYIIRGVQGEFYPCKPDIFEQTYEPVKEQTND